MFNVKEFIITSKRGLVICLVLLSLTVIFMLSYQFDILNTYVFDISFSDSEEFFHSKKNFSESDQLPLVRVSEENRRQFSTIENWTNDTKKITLLIWYEPYGRRSSKRQALEENCGPCEVSYDLKKVNEPETMAVVFHFKELVLKTMPRKRRKDQLYVWWTEETPKVVKEIGGNLNQFNDIFNLTMTYRRDSDIYSPYGTAAESYAFSQNHYDFKSAWEILQLKTKLAVWVVSNCRAIERKNLVNSLLTNGVKVDRFGKCFGKHVHKEDMRNLIEKYKFYFAFENSQNCKDYITEKFFTNSLKYTAVPVVFGATKRDYDAVAPPNSYIYANDFTVVELAQHLMYLDRTDNAYAEYHKWRIMPRNSMPYFEVKTKWCQLCSFAFEYNRNAAFYETPTKIVNSIEDWVFGTENAECRNIL